MRRREYYWSLHHSARKKRFDDLRTDQIEAIYSVLPEADLKEWQVWREGFQAWKAFDEFPILLEQLRGAPQKAIEPPEPPVESIKVFDRKMEKTINFELEKGGFKADGESGRERARYEGTFTVKIKAGDAIFVSKTVNISLNGIQLENALPKKLPKYFPIGLYWNREMIPLLCSVVTSSATGASTRLRIESNEYEDVLRTWLIKFGKRE
jgi:hypothetical protein